MLLRAVLCTTLVGLVAPVLAKPDIPSWLQEVSTRKIPDYDPDTAAVVLFEERTVSVSPDGRVLTTIRHATRILTRKGCDEAAARIVYREDSSKVRRLQAWLIYPSGRIRNYGKKEIVDAAMVSGDLYNEIRVKLISATGDADPGSVFGYESVSEEASIFTQFTHRFQDWLPVLASRFVLELPADWRAEAVTFNHASLDPTVNGASYGWQVRDLSPIRDEVARPPISSIAPTIAVTCHPPVTDTVSSRPVFRNWPDVSRWLASMNDGHSPAAGPLQQKALELTASENTALRRVSAIARFVQDIRYASISMGLESGGGYRPRPALEVLNKAYGDCKDKVNLMRAMLYELGLETHPVAVHAEDSRYVHPEWPSPHQFDHMIVAIQVPADTNLPAVTDIDGFGRLLLFDPTDEFTPLGLLPQELQGSLALLVAANGGNLFRVPEAPPATNLLRRTVVLELTGKGDIRATVREHCSGASGSSNRRVYRSLPASDYRKVVEEWISEGAGTASVSVLDGRDQPDGSFELNVEFESAGYAKSMLGRMLIFRPAVISRRDRLSFTEPERQHPIVLPGHIYEERVEVTLPEGFAADELPPAAQLSSEFGSYESRCEAAPGKVVYTRKMELRHSLLPASAYESVKTFFQRIYSAERTPVVLLRQ